jgi:amidohydrolase
VSWVEEFLAAHRDELIAFRHHLHAHPELSHAEEVTTETIAERLRVAGLVPTVLSSGTGLVCDVGDGDGPLVALRADIDALRMEDTKELPYRSTVPGVAHGCGHDLHTTIMLGAGLALAARAGTSADAGLPRVRLIFEPAEESIPSGAVTVIADGGLDGVDAIYGFHADPTLDVGKVGLREGPLTSASDIVEIELRGPGGHTARPHRTVDLVSVAARVVTELPARVSDGNGGGLNVVFGAFVAGDAANVIPTTAHLRGTVRTADHVLWGDGERVVREELDRIAGSLGAEVVCDYRRGVPPVVNSPSSVRRVEQAVRRALGDAAVAETPRSAGGDSFAWYQQVVPGCYARLGVHGNGNGPRLDLHSGDFDVDDRAIEVGIRVLAALLDDHGGSADG